MSLHRKVVYINSTPSNEIEEMPPRFLSKFVKSLVMLFKAVSTGTWEQDLNTQLHNTKTWKQRDYILGECSDFRIMKMK